MAACRGSSSKWFFTRDQLETTPSRRCGVEPDRELSYRQQAANLIQDMGQRLNVSQLTINTAIVYMHRFYMYHSFTKFHRNIISPTTLFLAAKVEEQPRKLEHVIKVAHACLNPQETPLDTKSNAYLQQAQELVILETIVLQTLGFEITIEHPHTDVVKCSQLVRASKDLAQTSYFMATNSLHLTTFCLQHKPTVIACVCIHLACKWSNWEIPVSTDAKHWWEYVDPSVTLTLLDELTHEFLQILEKTPSRLKRIRNWRATQAAKKPKGDGQGPDSLYPGPSLMEGYSTADGLPGVLAGAEFPKGESSSFPVALSLDSLGTMQGIPYTFTAPSDWPLEAPAAHALPLPHPHRADKCADLPPAKQDHHKHPPPVAHPAQKLSLDKYREKQASELAAQRRRQDPGLEAEPRDSYPPPALADPAPHHHRKPHAHPHLQQAPGCSSTPTASPHKVKVPLQGGERWDRASALKLRIPIQSGDGGGAGREELKMKVKVSASERHSSSDEGGAKSRHSSPLVAGKEKHREHSAHRHQKHGHAHPHQHSGNGRGGPEGPLAPAAVALRSPVGCIGEGAGPGGGGGSSSSSSSSSRKRTHPDASHNHHHHHHHHSKSSRSGRSAAGGGRTSRQEAGGEPRP
ncbi:cyclin-T2-like isoform X1 [Anguilla anguilla]|uniref:cyclin-T2-like isoform X1 n=1 Tax=Anguilla anguilla TaxID=7936 RepID=UPI0015AD8A80|nr:cyclin-T2-like isoform X1 [Anguilla anguilla]